MFTGRVVQPGEPEFLREDTDLALALAEEEAATCPQCGMLKAWCRDPGHQFSFVVDEEQCHATYSMAVHQKAMADKRDDATRAAIRPWARFKDDVQPDYFAGLDLEDVPE